MTLTSNEILILASPLAAAVTVSLTAWWSYTSVMRRRRARKIRMDAEVAAAAAAVVGKPAGSVTTAGSAALGRSNA